MLLTSITPNTSTRLSGRDCGPPGLSLPQRNPDRICDTSFLEISTLINCRKLHRRQYVYLMRCSCDGPSFSSSRQSAGSCLSCFIDWLQASVSSFCLFFVVVQKEQDAMPLLLLFQFMHRINSVLRGFTAHVMKRKASISVFVLFVFTPSHTLV